MLIQVIERSTLDEFRRRWQKEGCRKYEKLRIDH
jgi:hypothetical protein